MNFIAIAAIATICDELQLSAVSRQIDGAARKLAEELPESSTLGAPDTNQAPRQEDVALLAHLLDKAIPVMHGIAQTAHGIEQYPSYKGLAKEITTAVDATDRARNEANGLSRRFMSSARGNAVATLAAASVALEMLGQVRLARQLDRAVQADPKEDLKRAANELASAVNAWSAAGSPKPSPLYDRMKAADKAYHQAIPAVYGGLQAGPLPALSTEQADAFDLWCDNNGYGDSDANLQRWIDLPSTKTKWPSLKQQASTPSRPVRQTTSAPAIAGAGSCWYDPHGDGGAGWYWQDSALFNNEAQGPFPTKDKALSDAVHAHDHNKAAAPLKLEKLFQ